MQGQRRGLLLGCLGAQLRLQNCRKNKPRTAPRAGPCAAAWPPGPGTLTQGFWSSLLHTCLFPSGRIKWIPMLIISRVNRKTRFLNFSIICSEGK